ncbi:hypothetical protein [Rhodopirellula halodulae]|uniref:hypothetical protein n=1 Tax=Rhodopirellula halodulae TaxID=2894198 RepID=UPI001E4D1E0E|nr:hypothetical protein [Rhodopirellula sp. JC737]MCC9654820.1 hypothetical protein [Rhodopirellula sp. JC737]
MLTQLRDYLIGLCALVAMAGLYQVTVAAWLTPPEIVAAPVSPPKMSGGDGNLDDLFADTDWQRGRTIRLKTDDGMLLCKDCKQKDGQTWELKPITIVIGRGLNEAGSKEPILISASEGALIKFDAPLDVMSGVAPSIERGQLRGDVIIQRSTQPTGEAAKLASAYQVQGISSEPPDPMTATDSVLHIRTSNVGIDRRTIWTNDPIHMQVGRATMIGRVLTLHLAASASSAGRSNDVTGTLDRMELVYLQKLSLPLDDPNDPSQDEPKGVVEVRCGNMIQYDFALDQLSLNQDVELLRLPPAASATTNQITPPSDNWIDRFRCDSLVMTLRDPLNSKLRRDTAMDWIDRVEATGSPVQMEIRSQMFGMTAGRIVFDPVEGWLIADPLSVLDAPGQAPTHQPQNDFVRLQRGELEAFLSQIRYRFNPSAPKQLGTISVEGPGRVFHHAADSAMRSFSWQNDLQIEPQGVATPDELQVDFSVWCEGQLRAVLADGGSFLADRVEGLLQPATKTDAATRPTDSDDDSLNREWMPKTLAALGNVQINSPSLRASTNRMHLFFEQASHSPNKVSAQTNDPIRKWVRQPQSSQSSINNRDPSVPEHPATIRGDMVAATLTMGGGELTATDLSVTGGVEVTHPMKMRPANPAKPPSSSSPTTMLATLTGEKLRFRDGGVGDVMELTGTAGVPARLQMGDGFFIGPQIQVRPEDNFVWVNDAGQFVLPSHMLPALSVASGNPTQSSARWSRQPRCRFGGSMTFDGKVATLAGGVVLDTVITQGETTNEIQMRGDQLKWTLTDAIHLRTPDSFKKAGIAEIALVQTGSQPVELTVDQFARDGIRESRHHLQTSRLAWVPNSPVADANGATPVSTSEGASGAIIAPGPGSYRAWIRNTKGGGLLAPSKPVSSTVAASSGTNTKAAAWNPDMIEDTNAGGQNESTEPTIMGVHLIFQESMQGDLLAKTLTFRRGVRVAQQTLPDFETRMDATQMDLLSQGESTIDCDTLRIAVDPSVPFQQRTMGVTTTAWEIEAAGGVLFRTRTDKSAYTVTADRCGYAAAKDLFTVFGAPTRPARLMQTTALGKPGINLEVGHATMRLKTMEILSMPTFKVLPGDLSAFSDRPAQR